VNREVAEILARLDEAPAAVAVQRGPELRWEFANLRYRALLGGRELVGLQPREVLPDWAQLHRVLATVMQSGAAYTARGQRFLVDRGGGGQLVEAWFDIMCAPLRDDAGAVDGVVTVAVDVSEQVEGRQRAETLAMELSRAVAARDQFLSVASHELRTPLTTLGLSLEMMERGLLRGEPLSAMNDRLRMAMKQVVRVTELVDTLLDVTRLQAKRLDLQLEEIDLAEVCGDVVERARAAAAAGNTALELVAPSAVRGRWDRSRVDQVVTNLVSNALKYGAGKPVTITVAARGDLGVVSVQDRGIGIGAADHDRIFQRFERLVSRVHVSGLGLGLWISRQLAETMGGALTVESEVGRGATFTLLLPF
jgi:signal transduction histidine kinase